MASRQRKSLIDKWVAKVPQPSFSAAALGALGIAVLYYLMLILPSQRPAEQHQELIERMGLLFSTLVIATAFIASLTAAYASSGRVRWGWGFIAFSISIILTGSFIYMLAALHGTVTTYTGPLANIVYILIMPLALVSVLLLHPARANLLAMIRIALDGLIVAGSLLFIAWQFFLREAYMTGTGTQAERLLAVCYPAMDIALASVALMLLGAAPKAIRDAFLLFVGGIIAYGIADIFTTYRFLIGHYVVGAATDAVYVVGLLLVILAAFRVDDWKQLPVDVEVRLGLWGAIFPIVPTTIGTLLSVYLTFYQGGLEPVHLTIGLGVVILLLLRLTLVLVENDLLARRLRETAKFKTDLLRFVSHEVANPLTPVKFQVALLKGEFERQGAKAPERNFEILSRNVSRLDLLTKDVLDMARLDAGRLSLDMVPNDLSDLSRLAVESYRPQAEHKGIKLELAAAQAAPVMADPRRVGQVLDNLLNNAIKFTNPGGRIEVSAGVQGHEARVSVSDSGLGLTPEQLDALFQPFSRVHESSGELQAAGSGLGLYISDAIAKLHGGRLTASSLGPGKGAQFTLWLPMLRRNP